MPTQNTTSNGLDSSCKKYGMVSVEQAPSQSSRQIERWQHAFKLLKSKNFILDPWNNFDLDSASSLTATRYRYSAIKKKWINDQIIVKIETEPFDRGAMRQCFRLKKMPSSGDWASASNYVAKKYIDSVPRETYFDDVRLQIEAKLWGEAFNRCDPPKKVDIFQLSIIEVEEADQTKHSYHIERFMEGEYRKYNSNSGFVDDKLRNTPQAFSHFTFERSGHRIMIVDIQGVGDLYTDPQIHTSDGSGYSDGNLGLRGMALFFHSHRCNPICEYLGLAPFDLSSQELLDEHPTNPPNFQEEPLQEQSNSLDASPSSVHDISIDALLPDNLQMIEASDVTRLKPSRRRTVSLNTSRDSVLASSFGSRIFGPTVVRSSQESLLRLNFDSPASSLSNAHSCDLIASRDRLLSGDSGVANIEPFLDDINSPRQLNSAPEGGIFTFQNDFSEIISKAGNRRIRSVSESSDVDFELLYGASNACSPSPGNHHCHFHHIMHEAQKPASADHPTNLDQEIGQSILGQIHHELARLHEAGRFVKGREQLAWSGGRRKKRSPNNGSSRMRPTLDHDLDLENSGPLAEITTSQVNWASVLFHEKHAAQLGCLEAMIVMAHYYLGLPTTLLYTCPIEPELSDLSVGIDFLGRAAEGGDRRCMILLARYLDTFAEGPPETFKNTTLEKFKMFITTPSHLIVLPKLAQAMLEREKNKAESNAEAFDLPAVTGNPWWEACVWYRKAVDSALARTKSDDSFEECEKNSDDNGGLDAEGRYDAADDLLPVHRILARMAELHIMGGHGLRQDPMKAGYLFTEAGDAATKIREGQLAMRYYELAEEAWALLPEEESQTEA